MKLYETMRARDAQLSGKSQFHSQRSPQRGCGDPMADPSVVAEELMLVDLKEWVSLWYERAVAAKFIRPPFQLDDPTAERLQGYFEVGLSPDDAVLAFFGVMH
jgi:hypothetical protein